MAGDRGGQEHRHADQNHGHAAASEMTSRHKNRPNKSYNQ
jgi:hypothetical protein